MQKVVVFFNKTMPLKYFAGNNANKAISVSMISFAIWLRFVNFKSSFDGEKRQVV